MRTVPLMSRCIARRIGICSLIGPDRIAWRRQHRAEVGDAHRLLLTSERDLSGWPKYLRSRIVIEERREGRRSTPRRAPANRRTPTAQPPRGLGRFDLASYGGSVADRIRYVARQYRPRPSRTNGAWSPRTWLASQFLTDERETGCQSAPLPLHGCLASAWAGQTQDSTRIMTSGLRRCERYGPD